MFRFELCLFTFYSDKRNVLSETRWTGLLSTGFLSIKQGSRCLKAVQIDAIIISIVLNKQKESVISLTR